MASTGHFVNVAIAEESSYGSLSSGVPDASGLTYKVLDAYATLRTLSSESPVDDDAGTRDGSWRRPPRPNAAYDTSNSRWRQRMEGTFTIEGAVDPIGSGSGITDYDDHPLGIMLGTLFAKLADPASATENVAGSSGANVLTATTAGLYTEGAIIGHTDAAKFRFAQVTDKSGNDITHSPALDASGLSAAEAVRLYRTYYAPAPGQAADVVSFATRFDSAAWEQAKAINSRLAWLETAIPEREKAFESAILSHPKVVQAREQLELAQKRLEEAREKFYVLREPRFFIKR